MRITLLDLNNFSRYPTLSVGLLTAILRKSGHDVRVLSPLCAGVGSFRRAQRPHALGAMTAMLNHWTATGAPGVVKDLRRRAVRRLTPATDSAQAPTLAMLRNALDDGADLLMISAYTMYRDICAAACKLAADRGVPVLIGGPMFTVSEVARSWLEIPGLTALFAGEPDAHLDDVLTALRTGDPMPGLMRPGDPHSVAPPAARLDGLPWADYTDFPWDLYPRRIVPMMTGRGCGWGVCTFCSDVHSAGGRTFRSRRVDDVLGEMAHQAETHGTTTFTFLDLKLNSDPEMWHGIIDGAQTAVPGCEWTASLHVPKKGDGGLDRATLDRARQAGLSRLTTGLESGSQRILNAMARGTSTDALSRFVQDAHSVGLSVRMTSIVGHPDETAEDVDATTAFLRAHRTQIDRIVVNRLAISPLTPLYAALRRNGRSASVIEDLELDTETALCRHRNRVLEDRAHQRAAFGLLREAHRVNRKPLTGASLTFEGVL